MIRLSTMRFTVFVLTIVLSTGLYALGSSNKWRIEVSEGANSDGAIVFELLVDGYGTRIIAADIEDGYSENHVARVIANASDPPPVNTIAPGSAPTAAATCARACSTAARAARPAWCTDEGLPAISSACTIACFTAARRGAVAL